MDETTTNLKLPYIMNAQAQKHVTHNEALRMLDAILQLSIVDRDLAAPPTMPDDGACYLVAPGASGAWTGHVGKIAAWQDAAWMFFEPQIGWRAWVIDEAALLAFNGMGWVSVGGGGGTGGTASGPVTELGINATADSTNRLSVASSAALFSHDGAGHQLKINKASATDTASLLWQTGFSGRAELGLAGDDDLHIKVSSDGTTFHEAIVADRATGEVAFPNSNYLADAAFNLLQDSGRFAGVVSGITVGAFSKPAYLQEFNGAVFGSHAKFINNNSDHGGSASALDPDVKDLIEKIRNTSYRRNGLEFHVAKLTMGTGALYGITEAGTSYPLSLGFKQSARLPVATVHFYARAKTNNLLMRQQTGQTFYLDGVRQEPGHVLLTPADGWTSVRVVDRVDPYNSWGYTPSHISLCQAAANDEALIACLALVPGVTRIDPAIGSIPNTNLWVA